MTLLELPKELRLIIYEYAFDVEHLQIISYDHPTTRDLSDDTIAKTRFYVHKMIGNTSPRLLRASQQIYSEAKHLLYQPRKLELELSRSGLWEVDCTIKNSHKIDIMRLSVMRPLGSLSFEIYYDDGTSEDDMRYLQILGAALPTGLQVKTLELKNLPADLGPLAEHGFCCYRKMLEAIVAKMTPRDCKVEFEYDYYRGSKTAGCAWTELKVGDDFVPRHLPMAKKMYDLVKSTIIVEE